MARYKEPTILETNPLYKDIGDTLNLGTLNNATMIQTLWGGYGELVRLTFSEKSIIVKHVKLPKPSEHPRGWDSDRSHQRKLHSYQVEVNWYEHFSTPIDARCRIPQGLHCFQTQNEWLIVMEDLATVGFETTTMHATTKHLTSSLHWLANFHARYMHTKSEHLWEIGTYWHLKTRPDELKALKDPRLKALAKPIDNILNQTKYQAFVHGDAKLANFCFSKDGSDCAAVDFQYVGHGCGMKDIVYFMSSAIAPKKCKEMEVWVLDSYFSALKEALAHYHPEIDSLAVEQEWRPLFALAWADFQRFIKGWSPGHFKINAYSESLTDRALAYLASTHPYYKDQC